MPLFACVLLMAACASAPPKKETAQASPSTASDLYAGQPSIVHGTEFPVVSAAEGVQRGDDAWRDGKFELAIYLYVQALQFAPNDAPILRKLGALHEKLGNLELACRAFELALANSTPDAATSERLGLLYVRMGEDEPARTLLLRATHLDEKRWRSFEALGVLADRRKEYFVALGNYDAALRLQPRAASVLNNRGYSKFINGDLKGAEADFRQALSIDPVRLTRINLGNLQAKERRYGEAFKTFLEAYDVPHAYNAVGEGAMKNGDHQIARTYFENAATESPSYFEEAQKNLTLAREALAGRGAGSGS
jgi:tetratricopeptide (TPR) repeat protein